MATINRKPAGMTLNLTVTKGFRYDEVVVPPRFEVELLGAKVERRTIRYRRGQRVACETWLDFKDLEAKAHTYGGEVQLI